MPQAIKDEFSDMRISRQRRYQLRQAKAGKCVLCGKGGTKGTQFCAYHRKLKASYRQGAEPETAVA